MTDASAFWRNTPLIRWNMNRFLALFTYERNLLAEAVQSQLKKFRNETMEQGLDGDWDFTLRTTPDDGTSLSDLLIERKPESPVRQVVENEVRVEPVRHRPERKQIVLVDDDTDLTSLLRYAFTQRNYLVTTAASGTEAIRLLSQLQKPPSLMVLDRELPDMDGIELLRHIPESVTLNSPLIFLSSKDNKADILRGLKAGAREYVTKPFSIDVFLEKAIRLLNP
jgi:CheY-like chemotaxis protein